MSILTIKKNQSKVNTSSISHREFQRRKDKSREQRTKKQKPKKIEKQSKTLKQYEQQCNTHTCSGTINSSMYDREAQLPN
jgi:hypothetical protein